MAEGDYFCSRFEDRVLHGRDDKVSGSSIVAEAYSLESHMPSHPGRSGNRVDR